MYQLVKFSIVGISNTLIAYSTYSVCVYLGFHYLVSNIAGFIVSVLNAYLWNDKYVFKKNEGETRNAIKALGKTYVAYGFTGLLLASVILFVFVDLLNISEYLAQLLVLVFTIPLNFIINKYWSFKTITNEKENHSHDSLL